MTKSCQSSDKHGGEDRVLLLNFYHLPALHLPNELNELEGVSILESTLKYTKGRLNVMRGVKGVEQSILSTSSEEVCRGFIHFKPCNTMQDVQKQSET